jgi:phosphatidylglycerol:prolipoprotein diacylglycerol transferase
MYPVLFQLGSFKVYSYVFFNSLALLVGALLYFRLSRTQKNLKLEDTMILWAGALAGGFIGAKFFDIFLNFKSVMANLYPYFTQQVGTRTVLGGIIGGYFGVKAAKRYLGITDKTGDPFALAALAAMGIGRIGCLLGGCCYGKPHNSWFSVYLHEQYRYPTQIIEMIFDFCLLAVLWRLRHSMKQPGDLFKLFVFSYALFRFLIEFIRTEPVIWHGVTLYQLMALPLIVLTGLYFYRQYFKAGFRYGKLD